MRELIFVLQISVGFANYTYKAITYASSDDAEINIHIL